MGDARSIINFGELSKPANTLIEKISDAIGGIFKPYQIRRIAQAEGEADKIKAVSEIEISELQHRALHRFLAEEAKKQHNIETISQKALPAVSDQAAPQDIEDDWITNFFDKCRLISDEDMQNLWSRVLAGEANEPGSYSKRTVNLLATLDKRDAEVFSSLCSFVFNVGGTFNPLVYDTEDKIYTDHAVTFGNLVHLDSIGLIRLDTLGGFVLTCPEWVGCAYYHGAPVRVSWEKQEGYPKIDVGYVMLTQTGEELAPLCESRPVDGFVEYVKEKWKGRGYKTDMDGEQETPATPDGAGAAAGS